MMQDRAATSRRGAAALDLTRFAACAFVMLFHFGSMAPRPLAEMAAVLGQGWIATDFFLLLSGFVLARAYGDRAPVRVKEGMRFVARRVLRLWPAHVIVLAFMAMLVWVAASSGAPPAQGEYGWRLWWAQFALVYGWGFFSQEAWNVPTWTISALVPCYALFAIGARWLKLLTPMPAIALIVGSVAVAQAAAMALGKTTFIDLPLQFGLLRAIPCFIAGCLAARFTWKGGSAASIIATIGIIAGLIFLGREGRSVIESLGCLGLLLAFVVVAGETRFRETPWTKRLGRASYSVYLLHSIVAGAALTVAQGLSAPSLSLTMQWLVFWGVMAGTLVIAVVFDALVDAPLQRLVRSATDRPPVSPVGQKASDLV